MLKKNKTMVISMVLAIIWTVISLYGYIDAGSIVNSTDAAEAFGGMVGMAMITPYMIVAFVGTILHVVGAVVYKPGLTLSGLICECVSILLMVTWGFGFIPTIILGFIGYSKMRKDKASK